MILDERTIRAAADEARLNSSYYTYRFRRFDAADTYDLFISHSFRDKDLIAGLYRLFDKAGYKVYIDWIDDSGLDRTNVTKETAELIRKRIKSSLGLAYVATANATSSKWCPWELGVSDGMHGRACILPVMTSEFKGQEYLNLYPYLEYAKTRNGERDEFWVTDQSDKSKYIILRNWLKGGKPERH